MLVWRIEHKESGIGPYREDDSRNVWKILNKDFSYHSDQDVRPAPIRDLDRYIEEDEYCGFHSKRAIFEWFEKEEVVALMKHNYRIKIYRPKEYVLGKSNKQIFFKK